MVQWLRLRAPNAGGPGSISGQGTRSHMPQLRVRMLQLKTHMPQLRVRVLQLKTHMPQLRVRMLQLKTRTLQRKIGRAHV